MTWSAIAPCDEVKRLDAYKCTNYRFRIDLNFLKFKTATTGEERASTQRESIYWLAIVDVNEDDRLQYTYRDWELEPPVCWACDEGDWRVARRPRVRWVLSPTRRRRCASIAAAPRHFVQRRRHRRGRDEPAEVPRAGQLDFAGSEEVGSDKVLIKSSWIVYLKN